MASPSGTVMPKIAGLLLMLGVVLLPTAPAEAASHAVMIHNYAYSPASLSIAQGDTVTWTNMDTAEHDVVVTSGPVSFRSPMLSKGESWSYTFTTAGSYGYTCSVHPDMRGAVSAKAAAPPPTPSKAQPDPAQPPAAAPSTAPQQTAPAAPPPRTTPSPTAPAAEGKQGHQAAAPSSPAATPTTAAPPAQPAATLSPLLLVAGASVAVVVFCLLLMASRPQPVPAPAESEPNPRT